VVAAVLVVYYKVQVSLLLLVQLTQLQLEQVAHKLLIQVAELLETTVVLQVFQEQV